MDQCGTPDKDSQEYQQGVMIGTNIGNNDCRKVQTGRQPTGFRVHNVDSQYEVNFNGGVTDGYNAVLENCALE